MATASALTAFVDPDPARAGDYLPDGVGDVLPLAGVVSPVFPIAFAAVIFAVASAAFGPDDSSFGGAGTPMLNTFACPVLSTFGLGGSAEMLLPARQYNSYRVDLSH
jgi:hypothetical protein